MSRDREKRDIIYSKAILKKALIDLISSIYTKRRICIIVGRILDNFID